MLLLSLDIAICELQKIFITQYFVSDTIDNTIPIIELGFWSCWIIILDDYFAWFPDMWR